jgi:tetratricopeptide (TPR) repeat protein
MSNFAAEMELLLSTQADLPALAALARECAASSRPLALDGLLPRLEGLAAAAETQDPPEAAGLWLAIGELRQVAGAFEAARSAFERALALDASPEAQFRLGGLLKEMVDLKGAEGLLEAALAADQSGGAAPPILARDWNSVGELRQEQGHLEDALAALSQAQELPYAPPC